MKIKVCGITQISQLQTLNTMDIAFAGFIFYERSPRYVVGKIFPEEMKMGIKIKKIGVFANADLSKILETVTAYSLDMVQLHGDESPDVCRQLSQQTKVIKVFRIQSGNINIEQIIEPYRQVCDYFLFDTAPTDQSYGGTGKKFDWHLINNAIIQKPFFLSGGISGEDVCSLKSFSHPDLYAIDINSRFETAPGIKNLEEIQEFETALNG